MTTTTPTNDPAPATAAALRTLEAVRPPQPLPSPFARMQKAMLMGSQLAARSVANEAATAAVLPWRMDAGTWQELAAMQQAVWGRLAQQHKAWLDGCAALAREQQQIKQANTLSKFVEQEYNLLAQTSALVASQCTAFVGLLENVQVDYAYWVSQKTQS
ncbi:hypothetical protein [Pseudorhodoferax sp.]|uniref:hypothetical protein n=1 Tax=Pseudorhodoferax sp. TaxID=1993553 RepID=UPI002DD6497F|nr:hypothetical protein [Pseudorhodoferax sp.]